MLIDSEGEETCKEVSVDPEAQPSRPDLVHARTASWVSTQVARKSWEEKYATRMACLEGGALSGVGVPFKVTGGEIAETRKLLTDILATHPESCPVERKTADTYSKSVLTLGDPDRFKKAGYDAIKELLQETSEVLVACRHGEPYMEQLDIIKKRKQAIIDAKAKADVQFPIVRVLSNETLRKIYRKQEKRGSKDEDGEEEEEVEETILESPECSFETLHLGSEFFTEKLTCIFQLLCSLHNMRQCLLRSRKPLNREVVFSFRRFPFENSQQTDSSFRVQLPGIDQLMPWIRDLAAAPTSQTTGLEPSHSIISLGSDVSSAASSRHRVWSPGTSRVKVGGNSPSSTKINLRRVDVWEDLLAVKTGETLGKSSPTKYRPPWQQSLTRDSLQLHLSHQKKKRNVIKDQRSKMAVLKTDPTLLVPNFREFLAQTREKVHRKTLQELEKLESCRRQKFRLVFQSLNSVGEIPEKYFPLMRKLLKKTDTEYTSEWFRHLVDEAESLQMDTKNVVVFDLLKKLKQFVYNQPTDQLLYREKMCLLVHSLPADEVCRPAWQSALIFVMVRVFEWKLEVLKYWLSTRHLYILQYIEDNN